MVACETRTDFSGGLATIIGTKQEVDLPAFQTMPRRLADEGAQTTKVTVSNERESSYESLRLRRRSPRVHYS